jgi:hypothetical protein
MLKRDLPQQVSLSLVYISSPAPHNIGFFQPISVEVTNAVAIGEAR